MQKFITCFFFFAILSVLILLFSLKNLLFSLKNLLFSKKGWFSKTRFFIFLKNTFIIPPYIIIETSFLLLYKNIFLNDNFPGKIYLQLNNIYSYIFKIFGKNSFLMIFFFYFLPQIILPILFFTEITFFHQIRLFYQFFPIYLISIFFNILFLKALFDFGTINYTYTRNFIELVKLLKVLHLQ